MLDIETVSLIVFTLVSLQIAKYFEVKGELEKSQKVEDFVCNLVRRKMKNGIHNL